MIIALAFFAIAKGAVLNADCDFHKVVSCTDAFAEEIGLTPMRADPNIIVKKIEEIVQKEGLDGQKKICGIFQNLRTCFGDQYSTCVSMAYLESLGESAQDAATFVVLGNQEKYICTTGWDVSSKNWNCIDKVTKKSQQILAKCQSDYKKSVEQDPKNVCKYTQNMIDCYDAPFKKACIPAVHSTMCDSMKTSFAQILPQCSITCSK